MDSMLYYFMWFWKDHVVVHMLKIRSCIEYQMKEYMAFQNFKILSFLENSPHAHSFY